MRADGTRTQRSTKETNREKAQKLANSFEQVARLQMTARQAQRVIGEIFQRASGDSLPSTSVRGYFESWLVRKKSETVNSTHVFYSCKARRFLDWLGDRAERQLITVMRGDILAFRESEGLSGKSTYSQPWDQGSSHDFPGCQARGDYC